MKRLLNILFLLIVSGVIYISCKKSYSPPAINVDYRYLTIDGSLINSVDSPSVITLSQTARLTDSSLAYNPETGATVSVEDSAGGSFAFAETGGRTANPVGQDRCSLRTRRLIKIAGF